MKVCNVLVVGGAGYIGSHMVKSLLDNGSGVVTLDDLSTGYRELVRGGEFYKGSMNDQALLDKIFSENRINAVMQFAAYSLVGESVADPLKYYKNNICGTMGLIRGMLRNGVKKIIFSSTAAVYGEPDETPITEAHRACPTNPYGATKIAVERMLQDCDTAYGLKYVSLRYFNAAGADESGKIGERHEPESHLIPLILKTAAGERKNISIFGTDYPTSDGTCIRDYIHVNDLAKAHSLALEALVAGSPSAVYNLGNSKGYSVNEVIDIAKKITGLPISVVESGRRLGDPAVLIASSDKIKKELGWKPQHEDLETIISTAWRWHASHKEN
jgi:UDP-glucose 4-epimerase